MIRLHALLLVGGPLATLACVSSEVDPATNEAAVTTEGGLGSSCIGFGEKKTKCAPAFHCAFDEDDEEGRGTCREGAEFGAACGGSENITCRDGAPCFKAQPTDRDGVCGVKVTCAGLASCDSGDQRLDKPCNEEGCYTRTMCGTEAHCKRELVTQEGELVEVKKGPGPKRFGLKEATGRVHELRFPESPAPIVLGRIARAHGSRVDRDTVRVDHLTMCPAPGTTVSCATPPGPDVTLCGMDLAWAKKACEGVRFAN